MGKNIKIQLKSPQAKFKVECGTKYRSTVENNSMAKIRKKKRRFFPS